MKLSIIIVNYKTPGLVLNCITSIYKYDTTGIEIIVVDNFSNDNTEELVKQNFPVISFIQMGYNAGFARANNVAIKIAKAEVVLLLNSDTIIENNALNICLNEFSSSEYIACGVQLLNEDRTPQISGNFAMKGGLNYLLPLPYVGAVLKSIANLLHVKKPNVPNATGIVEVDWINGAFLMVKQTAIAKAGFLDEDFFLYAEEAEWCNRLKKQGKLCIYGKCHVIHLQGESANESFASSGKGYFNLYDRKGLQIMLSNFLRIRKQFGIGWYLFGLLFYFFTIPVFLIVLLFDKIIFQQKSRYSFKQWLSFSKNVFSLIGFSGKIIAGKPYFYKVL